MEWNDNPYDQADVELAQAMIPRGSRGVRGKAASKPLSVGQQECVGGYAH